MIKYKFQIYFIALTACGAGYMYLFYEILSHSYGNSDGSFCLIKRLLHIPCPSCGVTRSVLNILKGHFFDALKLNPLGFLVLFIMLAAPMLILSDIIRKKSLFYTFYLKTEAGIRKPKVAVSLVVLITANWIWNIIKGI